MKSIDYYKKNIKFLVGDNFTVEFEEGRTQKIVALTISIERNSEVLLAYYGGRTLQDCYEGLSNQIQKYALEELSFENYVNKHF